MRFLGHVEYGLAKSILNAINPGMLRHLCLDMVSDCIARKPRDEFVAGQTMTLSRTSGLLTPLTSRCTALRTLVLRRTGRGDLIEDLPEFGSFSH